MPRIRHLPEDFEVEEIPLFDLSGEGQHTYLWIEKRERTTDEVWRELAQGLDLSPRDIGYAGRKDRRAVTRQWFSVPVTDDARLDRLELENARVLDVQRSNERLRVGQLEGNRFKLKVREVERAAGENARQRLNTLFNRGMPNRYGHQRFGRDGRNAERGVELLRGGRLRGDRRHAWLMVSALQSLVFNRVLERRPVGIDELLPGDLAVDHGTGELTLVEEPSKATDGLRNFEVSPTGPIFGSKMRSPGGAVRVLEESVMSEVGVPPMDHRTLPPGLRLYGERRPLRVRPLETSARWRDNVLDLSFILPSGSYATVLLEELFPDGYEEGPPPEPKH